MFKVNIESRSQKLKMLLLSLLFVIIFFVLDYTFGNILRYYYYFDKPDMNKLMWNDFYKEDKNSIDVFFLGSSHARFAFNTDQFDKGLNVKTFNLSTADQTPVVGYRVLEETLTKQRPKVLIYELYWRKFGTADNTTPAYFVYPYISNPIIKIQIFRDLYGDPKFSDFLLDALSFTYKYKDNFIPLVKKISHGKIHRRYKYSDGRLVFDKAEYYKKGYFGSKFTVSENDLKTNNSFVYDNKNFKWESAQIQAFEDTVDLCNKKGIKLIAVTAPIPDYSLGLVDRYSTYYSKFKSITEKYSIEYYDFNTDKKLRDGFTNQLFYDNNHLNTRGATYLAEKLIPLIIESSEELLSK